MENKQEKIFVNVGERVLNTQEFGEIRCVETFDHTFGTALIDVYDFYNKLIGSFHSSLSDIEFYRKLRDFIEENKVCY